MAAVQRITPLNLMHPEDIYYATTNLIQTCVAFGVMNHVKDFECCGMCKINNHLQQRPSLHVVYRADE